MNLLIIGASGLVGVELIKLLEISKFKIKNICFVTSKESSNKTIIFKGKNYLTNEIKDVNLEDYNIALLTATTEVSQNITPLLLNKNYIVIDNSSAFRDVDLTIPEINFINNKKLYVNPNCCVIQCLIPLYFINKQKRIKSILFNTYQSLSGAGKGYSSEKTEFIGELIDFNTSEENKLIYETKKLLNIDIPILANCIRIPVKLGHLVNIIIEVDVNYEELLKILKNNTIYTDNFVDLNDDYSIYTMRLKKVDNKFSFYTYSNNLLRGSSYNSFKILENIIANNR